MAYKPAAPFTVPMKILQPAAGTAYGVTGKIYSDPAKSEEIFGSFRTFGGTEGARDGLYTIIDTATVDTWYRPDITADCRIYLSETGEVYDIIADPEDIDRRHQYMQIKLRKVGGRP